MRTVASRERHRRLPRACGIRPIGVPDPIKYSINVQSSIAGGNISEALAPTYVGSPRHSGLGCLRGLEGEAQGGGTPPLVLPRPH